MAHLLSDILHRLANHEWLLKRVRAKAEDPELSSEDRMKWQKRARTVQAQIKVLEQMAEASMDDDVDEEETT